MGRGRPLRTPRWFTHEAVADVVDKATRSRMMSAVKGTDTKLELMLRRALLGRGRPWLSNSSARDHWPTGFSLDRSPYCCVCGWSLLAWPSLRFRKGTLLGSSSALPRNARNLHDGQLTSAQALVGSLRVDDRRSAVAAMEGIGHLAAMQKSAERGAELLGLPAVCVMSSRSSGHSTRSGSGVAVSMSSTDNSTIHRSPRPGIVVRR